MNVLIKSGSIHFKNSLIATDIVRRVIVFSCILVPTCRYSHFHNLAQWTGDQVCSYLVWCVEFTMLLSYTILKSILCLCCMEWHQRNKVQITLIVSCKA